MTNPSNSVVKPDVLKENMQTIRSFLRDSYSQAKTHWQDSISFFKDEFRGMYQQAESCINTLVLPVNNFLKEQPQIDTELQEEAANGPVKTTQNNIVPVQIALQSPMEENY